MCLLKNCVTMSFFIVNVRETGGIMAYYLASVDMVFTYDRRYVAIKLGL